MSFPYELDLIYGSECSAIDPLGRLSFGKPIVVGDKVIFRSALYGVSNDYTMIYEDSEDGYWYPDFNQETIKRAYSQVEFNKSDLETLGNVEYFYGLLRDYISQTSQDPEPSNQPFTSFFVFEVPDEDDSWGLIIMSNETNYANPEETQCVLTTLSVYVIIEQYDDVTDEVVYIKSIPCTVKTFIEGVENTDSTYIPVLDSNYPVPVNKVIEFNATHRTCVFPVLVEVSNNGAAQGYDYVRAYFEVEVDSDNEEAKNKILNNSHFFFEKGKSYFVGLTTRLKENYSEEDYSFYRVDIMDPVIEGSSIISGELYFDHVYDGESHITDNIGTVYFKLINAETHTEITAAYLDVETDGTALIKL